VRFIVIILLGFGLVGCAVGKGYSPLDIKDSATLQKQFRGNSEEITKEDYFSTSGCFNISQNIAEKKLLIKECVGGQFSSIYLKIATIGIADTAKDITKYRTAATEFLQTKIGKDSCKTIKEIDYEYVGTRFVMYEYDCINE